MTRFSGRREVAIGLATYASFLLSRQVVMRTNGRARAALNARRVVELERRLGIHVEPEVQRLLLPRRRLLAALSASYVTLNVVLTVGRLMRLFLRRDPEFHRLRRAAVVVTLAAQPVHVLFPVAPPRSLDGFTDAVRETTRLDLDRGLVAELYNPLAAMPSIHLAYAAITADGGAPLYPAAVFVTVVATANHYVLDAVAGWLLGIAALRTRPERGAREALATLRRARGGVAQLVRALHS